MEKKIINCCLLKDETLNDDLFYSLITQNPTKPIIKNQIENLRRCSKEYLRGKLTVFIDDDESNENIRILVNANFIKKIFVHTNYEENISDFLKNSPKFFGFSKDLREIKKKLEVETHDMKKNVLQSKLKKNLNYFFNLI